MDRRNLLMLTPILMMLMLVGTASAGQRAVTYEITVTNLTKGQTFTPILVAIHGADLELFRLGMPAKAPLEILAEAGNTGPLSDALLALGGDVVGAVETAPGLLGPGETRVLRIEANHRFRRFSVAAMLIPTNDTSFALNGVRLPRRGSLYFTSPGYDAGTEENDQNRSNIPGPICQGEGSSEPGPGDEGFVGISNGFHDLGTDDGQGNEILDPFIYDWRNPVVQITVERIR